MTSAHATRAAFTPILETEWDATGPASEGSEPRGCTEPLGAMGGVDGMASPDMLRDAARSLDEARRDLGAIDAERALLLWEGLVRGRMKLVDWFDANGRRIVLVKLNDVKGSCAAGLTAREYQVAMGAALGESSKVTGYRLKISPSRVSALLRGSMRKLGVKTKAQLVIMVRVLGPQTQKPSTTLRNA